MRCGEAATTCRGRRQQRQDAFGKNRVAPGRIVNAILAQLARRQFGQHTVFDDQELDAAAVEAAANFGNVGGALRTAAVALIVGSRLQDDEVRAGAAPRGRAAPTCRRRCRRGRRHWPRLPACPWPRARPRAGRDSSRTGPRPSPRCCWRPRPRSQRAAWARPATAANDSRRPPSSLERRHAAKMGIVPFPRPPDCRPRCASMRTARRGPRFIQATAPCCPLVAPQKCR